METDSITQPSGRSRKWIVILTVLAIALAVLAFILVPLFQNPITVRCTGFTLGNYGPQFVATNHTDKPFSLNLFTEHLEGREWIADTNWPAGINLPPHESGNCFADTTAKGVWRAHIVVFSDLRDLGLLPRLRAWFLLRRSIRLGVQGLPIASSATFVLSPTQEFYIPGPTPPSPSSQ